MDEDLGKATIDLLHATKAIVERDLGLGLITPERLRYTIEARKEAAKELSAQGMSTREIAEITGADHSTIARDLAVAKATDAVANATDIPEPDSHVRGTFGTGENEWYTPEKHIELARDVMGSIDLDPASSELANTTVRAEDFFTIDDDGLKKQWRGNIWLNPPYAQPAIALFAEKMVEEWESGRIKSGIVLTHNYTDTSWFQLLAGAATAVCFTRGRVRFVSPSGELAAPTQGQAFFYFGKTVAPFFKVFNEVGFVMERVCDNKNAVGLPKTRLLQHQMPT